MNMENIFDSGFLLALISVLVENTFKKCQVSFLKVNFLSYVVDPQPKTRQLKRVPCKIR